ncbi:hypothetical protein [Bradyrhizobium sp. USDA 3650]
MTKLKLFAEAIPPAKQPRRYRKLDGKPPSKPRGRHSVSHPNNDAAQAPDIGTIPVNRRLGFRVAEFAALIGVSDVTIWRGIKAGEIEVIEQGGIKIIPRRYVKAKGYIAADDTI